jgi:hypothetical protein
LGWKEQEQARVEGDLHVLDLINQPNGGGTTDSGKSRLLGLNSQDYLEAERSVIRKEKYSL